MAAGLTSGDGYTCMNHLSVFSASLCVSAFKERTFMFLHVRKEMTDSLNLVNCENDFIRSSEHRLSVFGSFVNHKCPISKIMIIN